VQTIKEGGSKSGGRLNYLVDRVEKWKKDLMGMENEDGGGSRSGGDVRGDDYIRILHKGR